jgi:hypothetical protein
MSIFMMVIERGIIFIDDKAQDCTRLPGNADHETRELLPDSIFGTVKAASRELC